MKPTKALIVACLLLATLSASNCSVRHALGSRMNQYIKPVASNVGALISGIRTFVDEKTATISTSEIPNFGDNSFVYNLLDGDFMQTARSLRRRRRIVVRLRASAVIPKLPLAFKPFEGLKDLKFGKEYKRVLVEQSIKSPGLSWGKVTAMEGTRTGPQIQYVSGYGWSWGNAVQLYNINSVRKCKRILFWKKCRNENIKIPRGLHPNEIHEVEKALHNPILEQLRNRLSSGRILKTIRSTQALNMPAGMNQVQVLTAVKFHHVTSALKGMIGSHVTLPRYLVAKEAALTVIDEFGRKHLVEQKFNGRSVDLKIFSSI